MKNVMFVVMMFCSVSLFSQSLSIDTSKLSDATKSEVLRVRKQSEIEGKVKEISEWAGMGKEVGEAVNGALGALVDNVDKVSNTKVGKFTMILVAYKVMGHDLIGFVFIPIIMLVLLILLIWLLNKYTSIKTVLKKDAIKDDKGVVIKPAEYETYNCDDEHSIKGVILFIYLIVNAILFFSMFS